MQPQPLLKAPVYQALRGLQTEVLPLHMPGHKRGKSGSELLANWLPDALSFDFTEIAELDSIYHPDGPLLEAEQLTAELYAAKATYFTTNGSTAGVIGSLLACAAPGSEAIVPRNAHISILSAIILGDLVPRFTQPTFRGGRPLGITPLQLSEALARYPEARTVVLVTPSYEGAVGETGKLVQLAHAAGCLVVVDEAHGAHLPFHAELPPSAVRSGADLVVQSAHKTLSALTGGAWVHRLTDCLPDERVRSCLNLVQSTSPSWLILGSLDLARLELAEQGHRLLQQVLANAGHLRTALIGTGFTIWDVPPGQGFLQDPLKINLVSSNRGITGPELAGRLAKHGIYPELVRPDGVLFMLGLGDAHTEFQSLLDCLNSIPTGRYSGNQFQSQIPIPGLALRPREAYFAPSQWVPLSQASGRVAARPVYVYPPGIPLVYPGEKIDKDIIAYARANQTLGGDLVGVKGSHVAVVE